MREIPKIEDYGGVVLSNYNAALEQWAKEAEAVILEYEKEASIAAVVEAESVSGIQQQKGKA